MHWLHIPRHTIKKIHGSALKFNLYLLHTLNPSLLKKIFLKRKIEEVLINYEPRIQLQNVAVDDDPDKNRLVVDIYFYVIGVPGPQVVTTFLQRLR